MVLANVAIADLLAEIDESDLDFLTIGVYLFELIVPNESKRPGQSYFFPLVFPPDTQILEEPFAVEDTITTGGGLWLEEDGIIKRRLSIKGTTGWKPKRYLGSDFSAIRTPEQKSYYRMVKSMPKKKLSGMRHFQFLQDHVFRTYADLKKDPSTKEGTQLRFHSLKDQEHWVVAPLSFRMERNSANRTRLCYDYDIELLVVEQANPPEGFKLPSEDKNFLEEIQDGVRQLHSALNLGRAAVRNVSGAIADAKQFVTDIAVTVNSAVGILDDVNNVIDGAANFIKTPFNQASAIVDRFESSLEELEGAPDKFVEAFAEIQDALLRITARKEFFETGVQQTLQSNKDRQDLSTSVSRSALIAADLDEPPDTLAGFDALGTTPLPGDAQKSLSELGAGKQLNKYPSSFPYRLESGDTLDFLASRFLEDSTDWEQIAELNGLVPPYISEHRQPGTVRIGDSILIPSKKPAPKVLVPGIIGVRPGAPIEERLLGRDLYAPRDAHGFWGLSIDVEGGSVDIRDVAGVPNLVQAMETRLTEEQGSHPLYKALGRRRFIGTTMVSVDQRIAGIMLAESVASDPRIVAIRSIRTDIQGSPDTVDTEIEAEVRGFSSPVTLRV